MFSNPINTNIFAREKISKIYFTNEQIKFDSEKCEILFGSITFYYNRRVII